MATSAELLADGFGRIKENVADALEGMTSAQLSYRPDPGANPISWLVWHLTRIQDDHLAAAFGTEQVWSAGAWATRFGLPARMMDHGYGHTAEQVATVAAATSSTDLLLEYHEETYVQSLKLISGVSDADLDHVVDTRWTPPVTLGVRLMSVLNDDMQHAGQAAYVRGLVLRRG